MQTVAESLPHFGDRGGGDEDEENMRAADDAMELHIGRDSDQRKGGAPEGASEKEDDPQRGGSDDESQGLLAAPAEEENHAGEGDQRINRQAVVIEQVAGEKNFQNLRRAERIPFPGRFPAAVIDDG